MFEFFLYVTRKKDKKIYGKSSQTSVGKPFPQNRSVLVGVPLIIGFGITTKLFVHVSPISEAIGVPEF